MVLSLGGTISEKALANGFCVRRIPIDARSPKQDHPRAMQGRQIICRRLGYWSGCRKVFEQPPHCEILRLSLRSAICFLLVYIGTKVMENYIY